MECAHCHRPMSGRRRTYCDRACKMRAYRRRRAGVAEDAVPEGRRGRVALAQLTKDEVASELAAILANVKDTVEALRAGRKALERSPTLAALRRLEEFTQVFAELGERDAPTKLL
jgi:hypothetical protein